MMMIEFISFLDTPQPAAYPAKPVQGEIGVVVGEGIALKSKGWIDRIHPGAVEVSYKVVKGNIIPGVMADHVFCKFPLYCIGVGEAPEAYSDDKRIGGLIAFLDHAAKEKGLPVLIPQKVYGMLQNFR